MVIPGAGAVVERLGKQFGIGQNTVQRAIKVKRDGDPARAQERAGATPTHADVPR